MTISGGGATGPIITAVPPFVGAYTGGGIIGKTGWGTEGPGGTRGTEVGCNSDGGETEGAGSIGCGAVGKIGGDEGCGGEGCGGGDKGPDVVVTVVAVPLDSPSITIGRPWNVKLYLAISG